MHRYPAAMVAPFALIAPCVGVIGASLAFGEMFGPLRYAGMGLILAGLAAILLPGRRLGSRGFGAKAALDRH